MTDRSDTFRALHLAGLFVMPNPWDVGTARFLASRGFLALATTSSGFAARLGRLDYHVSLDELLAHTEEMVEAVDVPINVDAERGFASNPEGVAATVRLLARAGAAGCSIEDYDPANAAIDPIEIATERVAAAATAARETGLILTARAENHLYGVADLDDTIGRLQAYRDAGAEVLYAPGLTSLADIARLVEEVAAPVNVLARPNGPSIPELATVGVRRVSTGGALSRAAFGALDRAVRELAGPGTSSYLNEAIPPSELEAAFRL
jgi:2-methylisocitrate lyase-like PEP mutase family enzyme